MTAPEYVRKVSYAVFNPLNGKRPLLGHLDIELTERCNNRCTHCLINLPQNDNAAEVREMDTGFVLDLLRQAAALGCMAVRFTGGEPLLRPDFLKLYLAARRFGMKVILFTNARLITPDLASFLARVPPGRVVEVTVYGMHPESYDAVSGVKGSFKEFRRGVDLLLEYNVPFIVKQALLPQNRHELAEFEAWAATIPPMGRHPGYSMNFDLRARRDDPAKSRRIAALRPTPAETVAALAQNPNYVSGMQEFCGKFMRQPGDTIFYCGAGHGTCVDSYGMAQMCLLLRHPDTVFDLHKGTLREAITEFYPRFREQKAKNAEYLRRCAVCFLMGLCEQCPAKSWMENGTLDTPVEYLCDVAHAQARHLGLVRESEKAWEVTDGRERVKRFSSTTPL